MSKVCEDCWGDPCVCTPIDWDHVKEGMNLVHSLLDDVLGYLTIGDGQALDDAERAKEELEKVGKELGFDV